MHDDERPSPPTPLFGPPEPRGNRFEHMSAFDASFLYAEGPTTPCHVGAVAVFEGAPFFDERGAFRIDEVRARVSERLHLYPRLCKRPAFVPFGIGRPVWVDDDEFDIENHVHLAVLPQPGDRASLEAFAERLHMTLLDRRRPLWDLCFVGGLDDGNVALVERVHHAMVDGVAGVDLASVLLDLERAPAPVVVPRRVARPAPSSLALMVEGLREDVRQPIDMVRHLGGSLGSVEAIRAQVDGAVTLTKTLLRPWIRRSRTSLVAPVGSRRRLRSIERSLADVKSTGHRYGATVNDVVLAAVVGGVQALCRHRDEPMPHELNVLVPVSVRAVDEHGAPGNRVSGILASIPARVTDPVLRIAIVRERMAGLKRHHEALSTQLALEAMEVLPSVLLRSVSGVVHGQPFVDLVVTNVPGPPCPLYFLGAEMLESVPVVPLGGNLSVGIAALSYNGRLTLGIHADSASCPDVDVLVSGISAALDELIGCSDESGSTRP